MPEDHHPAYEMFSSFEDKLNETSYRAAEDVAGFLESIADREIPEQKEMAKKAIPDIMNPHVEVAQDLSNVYYEQQRISALAPAVEKDPDAPRVANVIDQDGNIIEAGVGVGPATPEEIFEFDNSRVKGYEVPNSSWESAVGKAFQGAEERMAMEGKSQALTLATSKMIGFTDRRLQNSARDMVVHNVMEDPFSVGWQRLAYPGCCAFCRMLAGRGAVYKSEASATFVVGRGKVRKVRNRPHKRGRKIRSWERPDQRQVRELYTSYHDHCHCKVIPRWTFNGAEMPLPPMVQLLQDGYSKEYYAAAGVLSEKGKPRQARPILRLMRKNDMSVRERRFVPTQFLDHQLDTLAASWPDSPYMMPPLPMNMSNFWKGYKPQLIRGLKEEGGIYARRKGNQYVGRIVNDQATRTQRKINRKIDQLENVPTWQKTGLKVVNSEVRRKTTRLIRYNAKQELKRLTGQKPTWNAEGLFLREVNDTIDYRKSLLRRRANKTITAVEQATYSSFLSRAHKMNSPAYKSIERIDNMGWWGSALTPSMRRELGREERRIARRLNRPFRRRATRLKKMIAKKK